MEKWLSSSLRVRQPVRRKRRNKNIGTARQGMGNRPRLARFGAPVNLFKDSDRDGVANVFDCKPFNRRKQDVISPSNFGGGMRDMYARREGSRQNKRYMRQIAQARKLEMERLKELQRINALPIQVIDNSSHTYSNTPYVVTAGGKWVKATSVEGKKAIAQFTAANKKVSTSKYEKSTMEKMGYVGSSGSSGTIWTKPAPAPAFVSSGSSSSGSSSGSSSSGSSGGTSYSSSTTTTKPTISSVNARVFSPAPSFAKTTQSYSPAPRRTVISRVSSWFRSRF